MNNVSKKVNSHTVILSEDNTDTMESGAGRIKFLICFSGIFVSYLIFGILQEKITRGKYGENGEKFTYTLSLVFVQCVVNAIFAKTVMTVKRQPADTTPQSSYAMMTLSYVGAMLTSNQALQYVNYPTQVVGKSVKPIPVMILGVLIGHKRYPIQKFIFVLMIVVGVALFIYKDQKKQQNNEDDQTFGWGGILLLCSLLMDGITGGIQDRTRAKYRTQTYSMMLAINSWSIALVGVGLLVTGEGISFLSFVSRYPSVINQMLIFSLCSAIGQNFIFMTVSNFGPLTCSIFTTTRKFFTILGSVILFQHPMIARQWFGTILVFIGLGLDSVYGKAKKV